MLLSFGSLVFVPVQRPLFAIAAAVAALVAIGAPFVLPPRQTGLTTVVPAMFIVVVAFMLRQSVATAGNAVDYEGLLLLPVLWLALYGTRMQMLATVLLGAGGFCTSIALSDGGGTDWVKAILWPLIAAIVGLEAQRLVQTISRLSRIDPLTELANRAAWDSELPREVERARRTHSPLSIAILDLDGFKRVNDERGHGCGDRILRQTASAWSRELRSGDLLVRQGGDEFGLLLPDTTLAGATGLVQRLRAATPEPVTCSIGVAELMPAEAPASLALRADRALLAAKRAGRNRACSAASHAVGAA